MIFLPVRPVHPDYSGTIGGVCVNTSNLPFEEVRFPWTSHLGSCRLKRGFRPYR